MRASGPRSLWAAAGAALVALCGGVAPVSAAASGSARPAGEKLDSFAGSCSIEGSSFFDPPATNTEQRLKVTYEGRGTCTGTLTGRRVSNTPVRMHSTATSEGSCPRARTTAPGQGAITFADGTTIRYTVEFTSLLTEVDFAFYGERSGSARGHGSFLTPRTPPDVVLECAGDGAAEVPLDISLTTDSSLVSAARGGAGRRDHKAPRVRVAGVPRKRCARRAFRAEIRIAERWSGLRRATLSMDGRRLMATGAKRFSRRIGARRLRSGSHRLAVLAIDRAGNRAVAKRHFRRCA